MIDTKQIRESVATICQKYGEEYWRNLDKKKEYPTDFVKEMTTSGFLNILIPEEYGGAGLGLKEACIVLEELSLQGAHAGACHAQMYVMGTLLRHGSDKQKKEYLPKISSGELRLQSFAVTEPNSGTDTTSIKTMAKKTNDGWIINGQKVWISRVEHSDLMILLARTKPQGALTKKTDGFSVFLIDIEQAKESGLKIVKIDSMINHHSCELFFDDVFIPDESIIGEEDKGFRAIMDGMNAERILIASECVGDGKYFIEKSVNYAKTSKIFEIVEKKFPTNSIITLDAGNNAAWPQRFLSFGRNRRQIASTCGSMGYAIPAAVSSALSNPEKAVLCCVGDGGFMMSSQEISTAVHYGAKIIILLINNSSYATIRMHQERDYPGRKIATDLKNPDFVKLCKAMGADAYRVKGVEDFSQIFAKSLKSKKVNVIEIPISINQLSHRYNLN